jgi:hypothetical protein
MFMSEQQERLEMREFAAERLDRKAPDGLNRSPQRARSVRVLELPLRSVQLGWQSGG